MKKMNYSVKFYPEKRNGVTQNLPIRLSVSYSKLRMEYYTGKRCDAKQWDIKSSRMKRNQVAPNGQTSTNFNADLDKIKVAVDELFKTYDVDKIIPATNQLRDDLKKELGREAKTTKEVENIGFFDRFDQYIKDAPLSVGRKKHLKTTLNKVRAFNPDTSFETLDVQYLTDFQNYLLKKCTLSKNTVISELRRLRAFLGYSIKHGWTTNYPFKSFSIDAESFGDPVFITIEERDKLFNADIPNASLSRVRDLFVFQCFIGCRVGDLIKLKKSNVVGDCIEYIAAKTKDDKTRVARVPLSEKAKKIISRYDLPNGDLLPYITDQRYNEYLKDLFRFVGLTRIVTVADPKTRQSIQKPICDIASSHMARRVFVGNLYRKGVKNEIIASMSGHTENSKAFSRYYNIEKEDQMQAIKLIE